MTEDLRLRVDAEPAPGLLRPAIEAALAGLPWPAGPEAQVAAGVAAAVSAAAAAGRDPSSGEAGQGGTSP